MLGVPAVERRKHQVGASERIVGGVIVARCRHTEDREDLVASDHHANIARSATRPARGDRPRSPIRREKIFNEGHVLWSKQDCVGMVRLKFLDQLATPLPATSQQAHPAVGFE